MEVRSSDLGIWDRDGVFHATYDVPLAPGQVFGWRLYLPCTTPQVSYQEEMKLPAPGYAPTTFRLRFAPPLVPTP